MAMRSSITYPAKRRRRRPILLIGGDKGGTGKSFGARAIAAWLRTRGANVVGYDGDLRNAHLARYYADSISVKRAQLRLEMGWTEMFKAWEQVTEDAIILLDLPGNIGDMIEAETARLKLVSDRLERDLINVWVASEEEDSIWLLKSALEVTEANQTFFWLNGRFGSDLSKFVLWNGSETRSSFVAEGGTEGYLPLLPIYARTKIARSRSPFNDLSKAQLDVTDQIDFELWWSEVEKSLRPLSAMIGERT